MTMEEGSKVTEPSSPGDEFELTAEMMVNDFDDERTLDEEEALEESEEQQAELSNLEKEGNIPLSTLLAMYGYGDQPNENENENDEEEIEESDQSNNGSEEDEENNEVPMDSEEPDSSTTNTPNTNPSRPSSEKSSKSKGVKRKVIKMEVTTEDDSTEKRVSDGESNNSNNAELREGEEDPEVEMEAEMAETVEEVKEEEEEEEEEKEPSMLQELYKDDPSAGITAARHLRSGSRQHSEDEEDEEDEDGDYSPEEDDWKKTIMVGSDYQAQIPDTLCKYDDAMPYENEDKLLWDPAGTTDKQVEDYLIAVHNIPNGSSESGAAAAAMPVDGIPQGSHVRDDEQALYLLLQCGHNSEEALRRIQINTIPCSTPQSLWSEEECRNFESGMRQYGKDFHLIQQHRVRTRTVAELAQFYYLWKKTERHDVFAAKSRIEKKKYICHPGNTDFMERFLDEQENSITGSSTGMGSVNVTSLISGDPKRITRTPPPQPPQPTQATISPSEELTISSSNIKSSSSPQEPISLLNNHHSHHNNNSLDRDRDSTEPIASESKLE